MGLLKQLQHEHQPSEACTKQAERVSSGRLWISKDRTKYLVGSSRLLCRCCVAVWLDQPASVSRCSGPFPLGLLRATTFSLLVLLFIVSVLWSVVGSIGEPGDCG